MNRDLESALEELAARAEQSHRSRRAPLPVDLITARARRGRRTRGALVAAGAAAAVVAVAGTAFAVLPNLTPVPPAETPTPTVTTSPTPTPTETPTPTPTLAPVVLPPGNPSLPFGACGSLADAAPAYPVDDRVDVRITPATDTLSAGGFVSAGGVIERPMPFETYLAYAVPDDGPSVAVVKDGVVVGTASFSEVAGDVTAGRSGNDGEVTFFTSLLGLTVCDPGDGGPVTAGRPLPAGTYELRPWASIVTYDGLPEAPAELFQDSLTFEQAAALGGTPATAVGEPTTVTVTGEAETQQPLPGADVPLDTTTFAAPPACGAPAPVAPLRGAMLDLQVTPVATTLASGEPLAVTATVQYTGPDRLRFYGYERIDYWVVQDGVVVGVTVVANDAFSQYDVGSGAPLVFSEWGLVLTSCVTESGYPLSTGDPLPAGEYTVYPAWAFSDPVARTGTGTVEMLRPDDIYSVTLGSPIPVTLT
ncbi:hypothetical protein [Cellulomonas xylanilytica]|uniref:Uncharacterized protein n=1 Tax=Cellulomonas xylanilytica TaxID=233583 RepID=A0A510UZH8_9CELL|nr:hypothetical protein [Cellulomonas xylanilytica]GEK20083.1 hypothetical protein CXY01_06030 [Cellulomonas xylanilytica]